MKKNIIIISLLTFIFVLFNSSNIFGVTFNYEGVDYEIAYEDLFDLTLYNQTDTFPAELDLNSSSYPYYFVYPFINNTYATGLKGSGFYIYVTKNKYNLDILGTPTSTGYTGIIVSANNESFKRVNFVDTYKITVLRSDDNVLSFYSCEKITESQSTIVCKCYDSSHIFSEYGFEVLYTNMDIYNSVLSGNAYVCGDELLYSSTDFEKPSNSIIGDSTSKLKIIYEYNENFTECRINATLIDGAFTDKIYYSNYLPSITGELLSKKGFDLNGITITENQSLYFQAEDKDGNIIATNSLSVDKLSKLDSSKFTVNFNFNKGMGLHSGVTIIPSLDFVYTPYYDIYYKTSFEDLLTQPTGPLTNEYTLINNNSDLYFFNIVESDFKIYFEVRNRATNTVVLTKSYDVHLSMNAGDLSPNYPNGSVTGGIINEGTEYEEIMTPSNDNNFGLGFDGITETSTMTDLLNSARGSLETFKAAFSILPDFIWSIISSTLIIIIILRVLGR